MDKQLVLLVIMFFALLLKALIYAVRDSTWTDLKTKKFYLFLTLNLVAPVLLLLIKSLFSVFERDLTKDILLSPQGVLTPGLVSGFLLYGLSVLCLFLSLKLWPFAKGERSTFKTLIWVLVIVFVFELVTGFKSPGELYHGPLA